jgi:hypothetical protein
MASAVAAAPGRAVGANALTRWMWTWVAIGVLVVLVVVGFLVGIVSALENIDTNLAEANSDVKPLPAHVADINGSLGSIDTVLKPIAGQADQIITNLTSIQGSLISVDSSLKSTSGTLVGTSGSLVNTSNSLIDTSNSLVDTSGILGGTAGVLDKIAKSLVDTSNVLNGVKGRAVEITTTLEDAEQPADNLGAHDIFERVAIANDALNPVRADTTNVIASLKGTNGSLKNICVKAGAGTPC